eukprot:2324461-Rhodomonas_salina.3
MLRASSLWLRSATSKRASCTATGAEFSFDFAVSQLSWPSSSHLQRQLSKAMQNASHPEDDQRGAPLLPFAQGHVASILFCWKLLKYLEFRHGNFARSYSAPITTLSKAMQNASHPKDDQQALLRQNSSALSQAGTRDRILQLAAHTAFALAYRSCFLVFDFGGSPHAPLVRSARALGKRFWNNVWKIRRCAGCSKRKKLLMFRKA